METIISSNLLKDYRIASIVIKELKDNAQKYGLEESILYFGFPKFYGYEEESNDPDLILLSKLHGIVALRFLGKKGSATSEKLRDDIEELYSLIFSKLIESKIIRQAKNKIKVPLEAFYYIDGNTDSALNEIACASIDDLAEKLKKLNVEAGGGLSDEIFIESRSILEGTKALAPLKKRDLVEGDVTSEAYIISRLDEEIKTFDFEQRKSAVTIIEGPQRIRGLAGSGKTVVLAMKAAQIHINEPNKKILFTFYTKSLYKHVKDLITKFYRHYKKVDPNWDVLHVKHAWGGAGLDGVYYSACISAGIATQTFPEARRVNPMDPFGYICDSAVKSGRLIEEYDYVLIDEAQDMTPSFFKLVYKICRGEKDKKNIVWCYDELQNIFQITTRTPKELFGQDTDGTDLVDLDRSGKNLPSYLENDIVLKRCYRNPRPILICAHSLGFGIYNREGSVPVQMLEDAEHWTDLGYKVIEGNFSIGSKVIVERPTENSPLSIGKLTNEMELITYYMAEDVAQEIAWVVKKVEEHTASGLKPEEILIISLDDKSARGYFSGISNSLVSKGYRVNNLLMNPYNSTNFFEDGVVTLSTIHRAKGNEAAAVIVVGIDALYGQRHTRHGRNKIFTAFTRAKAWLSISGIKDRAAYFFEEIQKSLAKYPNLEFIQPDRKRVETIQRDVSKKAKAMKELKAQYMEQLDLIGASEEDMQEFFGSTK